MKLQWQHLNQYIKFIYTECRKSSFFLFYCDRQNFYWLVGFFSVHGYRQRNKIYFQRRNTKCLSVAVAQFYLQYFLSSQMTLYIITSSNKESKDYKRLFFV